MEYIQIEDIIQVCGNFLLNPTNKKNIDAFADIKTRLTVKNHLPIEQREIVLLKTLVDIHAEEGDIAKIASAMERSLTFNCLLAYTNIDPEFPSILKNNHVYNILWESLLCDEILKYCGRDYERLEKQLYNMISFDNLQELLKTIKTLDAGNIDELTKAYKNFQLDIDPGVISDLAAIARYTNPVVDQAETIMSDGMWETAKAIAKKQVEEKQKDLETAE